MAGKVPAYAGVDWGRREFWRALPLIDKATVRAHPDSFLDPEQNREDLWRSKTSGTSGPSLTAFYSPAFYAGLRFYAVRRIAWLAGVRAEKNTVSKVFSLFASSNPSQPARVTLAGDLPTVSLQLPADERRPQTLDAVAEAMVRHEPQILVSSPHLLIAIGERLQVVRGSGSGPLRLAVSSGARLDPDSRPLIEQLLGAPLCDAYGMNEFGVIASECAAKEGLHLHEPDNIVEVAAPDGAISGLGGGELVVSSAANAAMPLLRYRTGDRGELIDAPCACGKRGRRIRRLSGRILPTLMLPDGSTYNPVHLGELLRRFPIHEYRVTLSRRELLEAEVELSKTDNQPDTLNQIATYLSNQFRGQLRVRVRAVEFNPGEEVQRFRIADQG